MKMETLKFPKLSSMMFLFGKFPGTIDSRWEANVDRHAMLYQESQIFQMYNQASI